MSLAVLLPVVTPSFHETLEAALRSIKSAESLLRTSDTSGSKARVALINNASKLVETTKNSIMYSDVISISKPLIGKKSVVGSTSVVAYGDVVEDMVTAKVSRGDEVCERDHGFADKSGHSGDGFGSSGFSTCVGDEEYNDATSLKPGRMSRVFRWLKKRLEKKVVAL